MTEACCEFHPPAPCGSIKCPQCGKEGKPLKRLTLWALLKPDKRSEIPAQEQFLFCGTPTCEVVYFLENKTLFRKNDLSVRVGLKELSDPKSLLCYCFGWTLEKIRSEIKTTGKSTVADWIKTQVKTGNCHCEITNPQGSCCLGNISAAVKKKTTRT